MRFQNKNSAEQAAPLSLIRRWRFIVAISIAILVSVAFLAGAGLLVRDESAPSAMESQTMGSTGAMPSVTLQLTKEYIYADGRLLAIEDANAVEHPSTDLAVWRPSTGVWWVIGSPAMPQRAVQWGANGDLPVPGDYDGDGGTDMGIFRPTEGTWWLMSSAAGTRRVIRFGVAGDLPAQADFDGDGRTDVAVFRPSNATWYIVESATGAIVQRAFGLTGDVPAPSDYDGDGRADVTVWRPSSSVFYSVNVRNEITTVPMRTSGVEAISADYDGDGVSDFAVRDGATWIIRRSSDRIFDTVQWMTNSDIAVPNDYDGDGQVDVAVWRPSDGVWYIRSSFDGSLKQTQWGAAGDIPVPALYRR